MAAPTDSECFDTEGCGGGGGAVDSVNGQTGAVVLDAGDVGAVDFTDLTSVTPGADGASLVGIVLDGSPTAVSAAANILYYGVGDLYATKEDIGVAANLVADLPEIGPGFSTKPHERTPGFVGTDRALRLFPAKSAGVVNSSALTSLLTAPLSLPSAWTVGANMGQFRVSGSVKNNTGSPCNVTVTVGLAAGAIWSWTFSALAASASERVWIVDVNCLVAEVVPGTVALLTGSGVMSMSEPGGGAVTTRLSAAAVRTFTPGAVLPVDVKTQMSVASADALVVMVAGSSADLAVPA